MAKLERRLPVKAADSYFLQFARNGTSQGGEDGILEELFALLLSKTEQTRPPYCVDIGAWDGVHLSNTYALIHNKEWSGLLVEADETRCAAMQTLYQQRDDVTPLCCLVNIEGANSLNSIFTQHHVPEDLEFLSIDVDGGDYHLWRSLRDTAYRPLVVCIEFNPTITNDVYYVQPPSVDVHHGSSLLALVELGGEMGYTIVVTTLYNAIFVRSDMAHKLPPLSTDIHALHVPHMSTAVFQTYDGELQYVGLRKLLWSKMCLHPSKLQVLAARDRKFPFRPNDPDLSDMETSLKTLEDVLVENDIGECVCVCIDTSLHVLTKLYRLPHLKGLLFNRLSKIVFRILTSAQCSMGHVEVGLALAKFFYAYTEERVVMDTQEAESNNKLCNLLLEHLHSPLCHSNGSMQRKQTMLLRAKVLVQQTRILRLLGRHVEAWSAASACLTLLTVSEIDDSVDGYNKIHAAAVKEQQKAMHQLND
ncbi:hypothetical protein EON65_39700 [archaeon]|nr:MAG: hypothetical protein EON65_39700 [archaeon]